MSESLLIKQESLLVVFLSVLDLAQNKTEVAFELLNFLSEFDRVSVLRSCFEAENVQSCLAKFFALQEIPFKEKVIGKVLKCEWVTRVRLNRPIEKLDRFFPRVKTILAHNHFNYP